MTMENPKLSKSCWFYERDMMLLSGIKKLLTQWTHGGVFPKQGVMSEWTQADRAWKMSETTKKADLFTGRTVFTRGQL